MNNISITHCKLPKTSPARCLNQIETNDLVVCNASDNCLASKACKFKLKIEYSAIIERTNKLSGVLAAVLES